MFRVHDVQLFREVYRSCQRHALDEVSGAVRTLGVSGADAGGQQYGYGWQRSAVRRRTTESAVRLRTPTVRRRVAVVSSHAK